MSTAECTANPPALYLVREAAAELNISTTTVRKLVRLGLIRAHHIPGVGRCRVYREDIVKLLAEAEKRNRADD